MSGLPLPSLGRKAGATDVARVRAPRPPPCPQCGTPSWWNGWRIVFPVVSGSFDRVERREVALAKTRCSSCRASFTVYPPGFYPGRQFQLDVVADVAARVALKEDSLARAAAQAGASATSARRWSSWIAALAAPAVLCAVIARVDPDAPAGAGLSSVTAAHAAARVLHALEQLGLALVRSGVDAARAVRTGLARVLHWQHAAHGDVVMITAEPCRLSPAMAFGVAEVRQ